MSVALDRDALYYPYIHIRDVNWLKATLLCFPQVRRIVPPDFHLNDSEEVREFRTVEGLRGPLLAEEQTDSSAVYQAQQRLIEQLVKNKKNLRKRFSRKATEGEHNKQRDSFQIHRGKMLWSLINFLKEEELAWHARDVRSHDFEEWFAVNPKLGEAIMSVIAIAIAEDKGLDIVTSSGTVHHALASLSEDEVYNDLLIYGAKSQQAPDAVRVQKLADELAEVVMTASFDLTCLNAKQIADLTKEGQDLRKFKDTLIPIASSIPEIHDPKEREKRLKEKAKEVIDSWEKYKKSLPRFALDALVSSANIKSPELVTSIVAGATSGIMLASGIGLAIGLLAYSGFGIWRVYKDKTSSPYQYLSRIEKAGASLVLPAAVTGKKAKRRYSIFSGLTRRFKPIA